MRSLLYKYIFVLLLLLTMTGCGDESATVHSDGNPSVGGTESVAVELGASFHRPTNKSRMSAVATQLSGNFRGISEFTLIPFSTQGVIGSGDTPLSHMVNVGRTVSDARLVSNNHAAFYQPVFVPRGTASFLVYGHAPAGDDPFAYGSMSGFSNLENITKASDITFALDPIYSDTEVPAIAQELADYLTSIATCHCVWPTAYYGEMFNRVQRTPAFNWSNPDSYDHSVLADAFEFFSNEDRVMGSSSTLLNRLLTVLYNRLYAVAMTDPTAWDYYDTNIAPTPIGTIYPYRELAAAIRTAIANPVYVVTSGNADNVTVQLRNPRDRYPASIHLPDGAAGIQWNASEQAFQVVMQTKASAKLMSASRFCYPPFLCYYANSCIKTADDGSKENFYVSTNTWPQILAQYQGTLPFVNSKTTAVAITDAINYGVAQLRLKLRMGNNSNTLMDSKDNPVEVGTHSFPLTAVMVGPQYDVAYNFDPLLSSDEHTVYDPRIVDAANQTIYLVPFVDSEYAQTLVLPTRANETVYMVLEFQNDSETEFYGANGLILKGSKFYMTAKLDPTTATNYNPDDAKVNRVFAQDGYTEVNGVISDLKRAWNVVPDTRDPQLEVGVSMEMKWIQSTTTNVLLD